MEKVVCVSSAKVPIVKIWDPELGLACDMNVNNTLALENTRMVLTYVEIDERVRTLAMIVKHWTRRRTINDAGEQNILIYLRRVPFLRFPMIRTIPLTFSFLLFSIRWYAQLVHLDLHDHCLPPTSRPANITRPPPKPAQEANVQRWPTERICR